jgi:hypothetical protein
LKEGLGILMQLRQEPVDRVEEPVNSLLRGMGHKGSEKEA